VLYEATTGLLFEAIWGWTPVERCARIRSVLEFKRDFGLMRFFLIILSLILLLLAACADAQPDSLRAMYEVEPLVSPFPPQDVIARDTPNDAGGSISLSWLILETHPEVDSYEVLRSSEMGGEFSVVGSVGSGVCQFIDTGVSDGQPYFYRVRAVKAGVSVESETSGEVVSRAQWFNRNRTNMLIALAIFSILVLWFIYRAKSGIELFIRKISGLEAVDDAIGRATEMGRSVLYIPGIMDMDNIQTIASMVILGRVAKKAAEYEVHLNVPVSKSLVMTTAQEVVKESFSAVGRPDAYSSDNIHYLTDDQFGYAAGVDGIMVREKPATVFFLGAFYAESLILAETGHSVGAIQIAGTAMPAQLPFFVAACDYTLIGEELFAASAYLSKEPLLLGSLKGQDWGKAIFMLLIGVGVILETVGITYLSRFLITR
jgi:hypothetical protein